MAAISCFTEMFRLVNNSAVWLEKREYLLLPRFSLISDFALCDNRVCVLCHQSAERSRQEARETRTEVLGTVARCRRLSASPISWGVPAMGGQEQRSDNLSPAARKRKPSCLWENFPQLPMEFPRDALMGTMERSTQALCDQFNSSLR